MRFVRLLLCFIFSCFLILKAVSEERRPAAQTHSPDYQGPAKTDDKGTLAAPLIIKTVPPDKSEDEAASDAKEKAVKAFNDALTAAVAVGTLAVLIVQTAVFSWQAHRLKQTIDTMKELGTKQSVDMQGSIAAAEKAAEAALRSAQVAEKSIEAIDTPYLFPIIQVGNEEGFIVSEGVRISPLRKHVAKTFIKNCGNVPAIILEIYPTSGYSENLPGPTYFPPLQSNLYKSSIIPRDEGHHVKDFDMPPMAYNKGTFWINIQIRFADVGGTQFLAGFCLAHNPVGNTFYGQGGPLMNYRRKLEGEDLRIAMERDVYRPPT